MLDLINISIMFSLLYLVVFLRSFLLFIQCYLFVGVMYFFFLFSAGILMFLELEAVNWKADEKG